MTRALIVVDVEEELCGGGAERAGAIAELIRGPEREGWARVIAALGVGAGRGAYGRVVDEVFSTGGNSGSPSGFEGFSEDGTPLADWLHDRGVDAVDVVGPAVDHGVRATALDAVRAGFATRVLLDYTAGLAPRSTREAIDELQDAGVELTGRPVMAAAI
ncbi:isochorismatase family protein [Kitasatospora sp. NPDC101183]|uniref:isochorismatase family protein n=1 Tax=Kitasatospora sp. NPDC101183 TaxID=3364100 RepID=UPI003802B79D